MSFLLTQLILTFLLLTFPLLICPVWIKTKANKSIDHVLLFFFYIYKQSWIISQNKKQKKLNQVSNWVVDPLATPPPIVTIIRRFIYTYSFTLLITMIFEIRILDTLFVFHSSVLPWSNAKLQSVSVPNITKIL